MIKIYPYYLILICLSVPVHAMEHAQKNKERMKSLYVHDIMPHMLAYTKTSQDKSIEVLIELAQTNVMSAYPHWKFEHLYKWMAWRAQDADVQVDIAILKRYIAAIIDKSSASCNLADVAQDITQNNQALRWVVIADSASALSDECIRQRWNLFIERIGESIPMKFNE